MPLDSHSKIRYKTSPPGKPQYQADPPVCNHCQQWITRHNFGWSYLANDRDATEKVEYIECTSCTPIREGGEALQVFLRRHNLHQITLEEAINYFHDSDKIF